MLHATLNLGILAHVDAGKTTLTERLLYDAGVIDAPGSVDRGTTQTDTLALERERGITIRSAVVSFPLHGITVNLIDTPGHPDFIAEVERVLGILDGVVLVISAVEGVQAQTIVLMRALRRLRVPTLLFLNKTDRVGADVDRVLAEIRARLTPDAVPVWRPELERLAEHDDALLAAYLDGGVGPAAAARALAEQSRGALVHGVLFGSALTGEGVPALEAAIVELLPASSEDTSGPVSASVFKIERGPLGEKVAYVRVQRGSIRTRDRFGDEKVTAIAVFDHGGPARRQSAGAGEIAKVWGLRSARIGDRLGGVDSPPSEGHFAPPTLEAGVEPEDPTDGARLLAALEQLAEQDPLIGVRRGREGELAVSIYGEVQKEVLEATLAREHGLNVTFRETRPIYVERPAGTGEAVELLNAGSNPFHAQLGLRIEPAPPDAGVEFRAEVAHDRIPLYVYKRREEFVRAMDGYVREALRTGLHGWAVTDCVVTLTDSWYSLADGPPSRRGPLSTAADFRGLTPIVLAQALARAGTVVCEPILHVALDVPAWAIGGVMAAAVRLGGEIDGSASHGETATLEGLLPAVSANRLNRELPALTRGEGVLESSFAGYRPEARKTASGRR